jgi:hypothetical protein
VYQHLSILTEVPGTHFIGGPHQEGTRIVRTWHQSQVMVTLFVVVCLTPGFRRTPDELQIAGNSRCGTTPVPPNQHTRGCATCKRLLDGLLLGTGGARRC